MTLIEEYKHQAQALNNADFLVVTGRLVAFLDWMESKPQIKKILDELRATDRGTELISRAGWLRPPQAKTDQETAAVGLEILYSCRESKTQLWNIAVNLGIQAQGAGNSLAPNSDKAVKEYVKPALDYVLKKLEEPPPVKPSPIAPPTTAPIKSSTAPVIIQKGLEKFGNDYPDSRKLCFIMMRPGETPAHKTIERAIKAALFDHGLAGLVARDKEYHDEPYPNILTYLHGCAFGIAVIERTETAEFNPNVPLEVGYMLGLKKLVLLLKDQTLPTSQADLMGKLYRPFDPLNPDRTIGPQVRQWVEEKRTDLGI